MKTIPTLADLSSSSTPEVITSAIRRAWDGLRNYLNPIPFPAGVDVEIVDVEFLGSGQNTRVSHGRGRVVSDAFVGGVTAYASSGAIVTGHVTVLVSSVPPSRDALWLVAHYSAPIHHVKARILVCGK